MKLPYWWGNHEYEGVVVKIKEMGEHDMRP